ncbi:MAG TPA: hypothetical protein ENO24_03070 [Chloroflexi bacterium]|nr:hypothetical protein [Chloroflexota bacterium]
MKREMVVTDVTRMAPPRVCVAGFFSDDGAPVRPVAPFKAARDVTEEYLRCGDVLVVLPFAEVRLDFKRPVSDPPHTEDWEVDTRAGPELVRSLLPEERRLLLQSRVDPSVDSIFGAPIQDDRYICKGEGKRSLGTILVDTVAEVSYGQRRYDEEKAKWDYRIWFTDASGSEFRLAITDLTFRAACDYLRDRKGWDLRRVSGWLTEYFASANTEVYLRIGLARGWEKHPDRCYLQVTGVYSFPDYLGGKSLCDLI